MPFSLFLLPLISVITMHQLTHSHHFSSPSMMPTSNQFELNPAKIDLLLRRTALMALLRAKATTLMDNVPLVERVVFEQCVADSKPLSPLRLAKCLNKLIQANRDQLRRAKNDQQQSIMMMKDIRSTEAMTGDKKQIMQQKLRPSVMTMKCSNSSSCNNKNIKKLRRIRHFFALWRRRKGQRMARGTKMGDNKLNKRNSSSNTRRRRKRALRTTGAVNDDGMERKKAVGPLSEAGTTTGTRRLMRMQATKEQKQQRVAADDSSSSVLLRDSLCNLHELGRYMQIFEKARRSIARINAHNTELLSRLDPFVNVRAALADGPLVLLGLQQQISNFFNTLGTDQISVLSPRFFSLFPSPQRRRASQWLSPDIFSFQNGTNNNMSSILSIPDVLNSAYLGKRESAAWLELLLNITGSAKIMDNLVAKLKPDVQRLERTILPIIDQMERVEQRWHRLRNSMTEQQQQMVEARGYAPLADHQQNILFPPGSSQPTRCVDSEFGCSEESVEREFEQNIAELARMEDDDPSVEQKLGGIFIQGEAKKSSAFRQEMRRRRRKKRQEMGGLAPDTEEGGREIPRTVALEPFAFDTRLGGVVLEGIYLSPTAFYRELASPEVLTIRALSPIAFYASILSPMVAFARILSPEVFKAQILTPQLLDAFVLSPEAFMAEVLSPLVAEGRVLAPRTMFVQILGPTAGALHIGSPDTYGILVLSPHILSPRIYSEERYLIEILSPHFLGGEHERTMEEDTHTHLGGTVRFVGWPEHSPLGKTPAQHEHQQKVAVGKA